MFAGMSSRHFMVQSKENKSYLVNSGRKIKENGGRNTKGVDYEVTWKDVFSNRILNSEVHLSMI